MVNIKFTTVTGYESDFMTDYHTRDSRDSCSAHQMF